MEVGSLDPVEPATWAQVIHADLKPQNVFLANTNTSGLYAGYPQIKVGDLGLANMISHIQARVLAPVEYHAGTDKRQASEQVDDTQMVTEKTNCWGIGVIMWGLMNSRTNVLEFYTFVDPDWLPADPQPLRTTFSNDHIRVYSNEIRQLVLDCLNVDPTARPSYTLMLHIIRNNTNPAGVDRAGGLRNAANDDARPHDDTHDLKLSREFLPMYAALAGVMDNAPALGTTTVAPAPGAGGTLGPLPGGTIIPGWTFTDGGRGKWRGGEWTNELARRVFKRCVR